MLMQYWAQKQGAPAATDSGMATIQHRLYVASQHGIPAASMQQYLRQHGFLAFAVNGTWSDIDGQLRKGRPLIAAIRPPGQSEFHYVVLDGIDPGRGLIMMNDPAIRKLLTEERTAFEKDWSATHNWLLIAVPAPTSR